MKLHGNGVAVCEAKESKRRTVAVDPERMKQQNNEKNVRAAHRRQDDKTKQRQPLKQREQKGRRNLNMQAGGNEGLVR